MCERDSLLCVNVSVFMCVYKRKGHFLCVHSSALRVDLCLGFKKKEKKIMEVHVEWALSPPSGMFHCGVRKGWWGWEWE